MLAGEHRRVGFVFLSGEEAAAALRKAGRFFLWEGRCIGEAVVAKDPTRGFDVNAFPSLT